MSKTATPQSYLKKIQKQFPDAAKLVNGIRARRGRNLLLDLDASNLCTYKYDWPEWLFFPVLIYMSLAGSLDSVKGYHPLDPVGSALSALLTWSMTQRVYKFSSTLEDLLIRSPIIGNIPTSDLMLLPDWCVYIKTSKMKFNNVKIDGFFAHLDIEPSSTEKISLRILLDIEGKLEPLALRLGEWNIKEAIIKNKQDVYNYLNTSGEGVFNAGMKYDEGEVNSLISLILYLCSSKADYNKQKSTSTIPVTKKNSLLFSIPTNSRIVEVGEEVSKGVSTISSNINNIKDGSNKTKKPHIRRGHWHGYWVNGPNKQKVITYKWQALLGVNCNI